jgi:hypothetical protein
MAYQDDLPCGGTPEDCQRTRVMREHAHALRHFGRPGSAHVLDMAANEMDALRQTIRDLLSEPRRSVKLISKKCDQFEPMTMTVTKGQVLEALKMIK